MSYSDSEKNYWRRKPGTVEPSDELYRKFWSIKPKKPKKPSEIEESARGKIIESAGSSPALLPKTSDIPSPTLSGDDSIRESFQGGPQAQLYPDPRSLAPPIQQPNPYAAGGEKMFGNMSVNKFSILAGMAADAIAPNKLGRDIAAYADRNEQNRLKFEMEAPERAQRLQNSELTAQNMYERNKWINPRESANVEDMRLSIDRKKFEATNRQDLLNLEKRKLGADVSAKEFDVSKQSDVFNLEKRKLGADVATKEFDVANQKELWGMEKTKANAVINQMKVTDDYRKAVTSLYNAKEDLLGEGKPPTGTEIEQALSTLNMKLYAKNIGINVNPMSGVREATIPTDKNGKIPDAIKAALDSSSFQYAVVEGEPDAKDNPGLGTGDSYSKQVVFGSYIGNKTPASTNKKKKPEKPYDPDFYKIK